jgi:hypothetical protein
MPNRIVAFFRRATQPADDGSIGAILLTLGFITRQQLLDAITKKLASDREALIGEILIAQGAVTRQQLDRALLLQRERRGEIEDYLGKARNLVADAHARSEGIQQVLEEVRGIAEQISKHPPKLLPFKKR